MAPETKPEHGRIYRANDDLTELRPALADADAAVVELERQLNDARSRLRTFAAVRYELERRAVEFEAAWRAMLHAGGEWPETIEVARERYIDRCTETHKALCTSVRIARHAGADRSLAPSAAAPSTTA